MMGPRASLSFLLLLSAAVLLGAIAVGNRMGNHVLGQISQRTEAVPTVLLTPVPEVKNRQVSLGWKHTQVVSVATDPAFPDPRVTPAPPPPKEESVAHPRLPPPPQVPQAAPHPADRGYTSPPLPIPLVTHQEDQLPPDEGDASVQSTPEP
jgi:hypothetical protein